MIAIDSAKFRKCMALAVGGSTEGERKAGQAAAARVAVAAGLSFEEAERLARQHPEPDEGLLDAFSEAMARVIAEAVAEAFRSVQEEIARQLAARDQERRAAARELRRQQKAAAAAYEREMAEWPERAKAEQAERDRIWAEQRRQARESAAGATEASR
ncbi:hypothetical protein [Methylobacterium sp. 17Sr1-1]|uniref:hypothetical protein n=1 Tax=Methylobacterium sp. 17Sr1-1 TaxID=2202826 RepID=UPI000D6FC644|nr:hypothetical protein [Methylobacterium sp. 17Sr1-1]AWN51792.1 hypothetical protein DK412_08940 [Methylobacterium sp. 17Sr1-1]